MLISNKSFSASKKVNITKAGVDAINRYAPTIASEKKDCLIIF
jgi:hypothetical protein